MEFAGRFGEPVAYPFVKGLDEYPEITPVIKREEDRSNFGGLWHSDTVYQQAPPMGTILYGIEIPAYGGDTEFANQYLEIGRAACRERVRPYVSNPGGAVPLTKTTT